MKFTPEYIPNHLQGRVRNFEVSDDGSTVTFEDIKAHTPSGSLKKVLSKDEYNSTFNRVAHASDPYYLSHAYGGIPIQEPTLKEILARKLGGAISKGIDWSKESPGKAILSTSLLAALLGSGAKSFYNYTHKGQGLKESVGNSLWAGLGAGALAALAGYGVSKYVRPESDFQKIASVTKRSSVADVVSALQRDYTLSFQEKADLVRAVSKLSAAEQQRLSMQISPLSGAAIGAAVAKFIFGRGALGTMMGGLLGGGLTSLFSGPSPHRNAFGEITAYQNY